MIAARNAEGKLSVLTGLLVVGLLLAGARGSANGQNHALENGQAGGPKKSDAVVRVTAQAERPESNGQRVITVTLTTNRDRPWHIYANRLPPDFPGVPTTVTIDAKHASDLAKIDYPQGDVVKDSALGDYHVYEGTTAIKLRLRRFDERTPIELKVAFQACWQTQSQGQCLLPAAVRLTVP